MRIVPESKRSVQVGHQFGRWTVIGEPFYIKVPIGKRPSVSFRMAVCECNCGTLQAMKFEDILSTHRPTHSCGCLKSEVNKARTGDKCYQYIDGRARDRLYRIYGGMKERCCVPGSCNYKRYGARGISICAEWLNDYTVFRDWALSHGYEANLTIERNDVNGNYEPGNCCWITKKQQARNRRNSVLVEAFGEIKPAWAWIEDSRCVATPQAFYHRIQRGWDPEKALTTARCKPGPKSKEAVNVNPDYTP